MIAQGKSRPAGDAGFTLLETLIAMALMGLILAALGTVTAQWLPNWNRGVTRVQRAENLALGLDRLVSDLAAAEFVSISRETLEPLFVGLGRSVTFIRTVRAPFAPPGLELVRIAENRGEQGPVMVRTRAPFVPISKDDFERNPPSFADPVVLVRPPHQLQFSYAGGDRVWRDTWVGERLLPHAVRLTVRDLTTQQILAASTATVVHARLPARCVASQSLADCLAGRAEPQQADGAQQRSGDRSRIQ